jgi:DNA-3-methyladenine glycosylase II
MKAHDHLALDPVMAGLIVRHGKLRLRRSTTEPYEALCEAVVYQQLHAKAAATIFGRVVDRIGAGSFPSPSRLLEAPDEALRAAGLSRNKLAALRDIARHAADGRLPSRAACASLSDSALIARLTGIRGIGRWTVEMFLMFHLGRPDVLPVDDLGVRKGFQSAYRKKEPPAPKALAAFGERWAPYRTYAAFYLWRAADQGEA